ncbi:MAG: hypothetical protein CML42_07440 [Rhodobacteraceae bacterium]|nr:hypothetical protein [Paracoccaceae bacterium]|tara:strand:+ start:24566 stop:24994 length:429 start_codon:yes stop_codon:yes gene_type:complete
MNLLKMMGNKQHHYILAILLAIYILFDMDVPDQVKEMVDSPFGKVVVAILVISLVYVNPMVGALGIIAAFVLLNKSTDMTGPVHRHISSEVKKTQHMNAMNTKHPDNLEQSVVSKMLPRSGMLTGNASYKPTLHGLHDAAKI